MPAACARCVPTPLLFPHPEDDYLIGISPTAFVSGSKQRKRKKKKKGKKKHPRARLLRSDHNDASQRRYAERKNDLRQQFLYAPGNLKALPRSLIISVRAITRLMRGISKELPGNPPAGALFKSSCSCALTVKAVK